MSRGPERLAVVYDMGAASPREIVRGLSPLGEIVFLVPRSAHTAQVWPILKQLAPVVALTGRLDLDLPRVRDTAPTAILTFSEGMLQTTATLAARLGLLFHDEDTTLVLTDKVHQRQRLRETGVDDLRTADLRAADQWDAAVAHVGLPAVVKPVQGGASRDTHLVTDPHTGRTIVRDLFARAPESHIQVEEFLAGTPRGRFGDYVSVESIANGNEVTHIAVTGKFPLLAPFRESGRLWPNQLTAAEERAVADLAARTLRALGVRCGLTHTEIKLTPHGPRVIEVNGRLGGFVHELAQVAGAPNLITLAGRSALKHPVDYASPALDGVYFLHHNLAPTRHCTLVGVFGADRARSVPGIDGYRMLMPLGAPLDRGVMTQELDTLWGKAGDHDALWATFDAALEELSFDFRFPDGASRLSAHELIGMADSPSTTGDTEKYDGRTIWSG